MIKIKEIKVNGIRGFGFLKDESGNSLPHLIRINNRHLFLYGENGTGKSSFCDSIEWCLTGSNEESNNRKIKNNKDFLKNKLCSNEDNPFVEILFEKDREDYSFKRELKSKKINFDFEDEAHYCIIEAGRIEKFVIDTKNSLWQRFSSLLGFDDLISFDDKISRLEREAKRIYLEAKLKYEEQCSEIKQKKDLESEFKASFAKELGEDWTEIIEREENKGETSIFSGFKELNSYIDKYIDIYKNLILCNENIERTEKLLKFERERVTTSKISKIIEEADKYFEIIDEIDACPLCGSRIEFTDLRKRIKNLNLLLVNVQSFERKIADDKQKRQIYISKLKSLRDDIQRLYGDLHEEKINASISDDVFYEFICEKIVEIRMDLEKSGKILDSNKQIALYQENKRLTTKKEILLKELESDLVIKKNVCLDIRAFKETYTAKYSELIKKELKEICDGEISTIYNALNQSNEEIIDKFIIEPNIDGKEIEFSVQMKDNPQKISALEILSTGHLRCLGFALLIARIKVKVKNLNFIIIDDPIYSIDHEHRYNLIQYLRALSDSYQLLITSSDRLFYDIIRNSFNINKFVTYRIYLTIQDGIINIKELEGRNQYINEAQKYIEVHDFRAASLYARLSLETKLVDVAKKLKLKIPMNRMEKITMKELIQNNIREEIKKKNEGTENKIDQEFSKLLNHRYFKSLLNGFPLDEEVHYPHENRNIYSKQEIESAIITIKDFNEFLDSLSM